MLINVMRAKLHRLTVTQADLNYIGSISLDPDLVEAAGLVEGEKVQIVNINNGERIETYVILGERGTGQVCLNGPAARRVQPGDVVIVIAYGMMTVEEARSFEPTVLFPDTATNRLGLPGARFFPRCCSLPLAWAFFGWPCRAWKTPMRSCATCVLPSGGASQPRF